MLSLAEMGYCEFNKNLSFISFFCVICELKLNYMKIVKCGFFVEFFFSYLFIMHQLIDTPELCKQITGVPSFSKFQNASNHFQICQS